MRLKQYSMRSVSLHDIWFVPKQWSNVSRPSASFVAYVCANEPGTLRYDVWQEEKAPARFVHIFVFRDAEADRIHSESQEAKKFEAILYPECPAPVEFIDYKLVG